MSVNLHLGVVVRGYHPDRRGAIESAIREVLKREEIAEDLPPLTEAEDSNGRILSSRSDPARPVIITGAYAWAMRVGDAIQEAAAGANGGPCQVRFEWDDADEGRECDDDECDDEE